MSFIYISIFFTLFLVFLYFGYKDDFNRDKIGFKIGSISIIVSLIIIFCLYRLNLALEVSLKQTIKEHYIEQLGWKKELGKVNLNDFKSELNTNKIIEESHILTRKIDTVLSIFNTFYFLLVYLIINQFNKFVKRYFYEKY